MATNMPDVIFHKTCYSISYTFYFIYLLQILIERSYLQPPSIKLLSFLNKMLQFLKTEAVSRKRGLIVIVYCSYVHCLLILGQIFRRAKPYLKYSFNLLLWKKCSPKITRFFTGSAGFLKLFAKIPGFRL